VLFSKTPSEKAAIGLTEQQVVHLLRRGAGPDDWSLMAEWDANEFSHTDFMSAMHQRNEPADPADLLDVLPPALRQKLRFLASTSDQSAAKTRA
jgi:hypothetical protein